jgi:hypothetical protein
MMGGFTYSDQIRYVPTELRGKKEGSNNVALEDKRYYL